jgi:hypothetical protein
MVEVNKPITFINTSNDSKPFITGSHLGLIRSHTTTLQHRRSKDRKRQTTGSIQRNSESSEYREHEAISKKSVNRSCRQTQITAIGRQHDVDSSSSSSYQQIRMGGGSISQSQSSSGSPLVDAVEQESAIVNNSLNDMDGLIQSNAPLDLDDGLVLFPEFQALSGKLVSDSYRNDPFDSLPAANTRDVQILMDYCQSYRSFHSMKCLLTHFLVVQTFSKQMDWIYGEMAKDCPHMNLILPLAIQVPYHFHTVLVLCRLFQIINSGKPPNNDLLLMYHRSMALQYLQVSLGDVTNEALPLAVVAFISIDVQIFNSCVLAISNVISGYSATCVL